jgi:hypothetical protein
MDTIIKNIIVTDTIANTIANKYHKELQEFTEINTGYSFISPNMIIENFTLNNIFELKNDVSIGLTIFVNCLKNTDKYNFKLIDTKIKETINKIKIDNKYIDYDKQLYLQFKKNGPDKSSNDANFLEIAIVISLLTSNFDELLNNLSEFINSYSKNSIKILSFMSIGIFAFYAKKYYLLKDETYAPTKWINILIDLFLNGIFDKFLPNDKSNDKKKFIFMIINYASNYNAVNYDYPHQRIRELDNYFCVNINSTKDFVPGLTADQTFLLSYDFFLRSRNWIGLITFNCLTYTEIKHINLISSFYYFMINSDCKMFLKFDALEGVSEIDEFVIELEKKFN